MVETIDKILCTGCKMCGDICPTDAISFETDEEGFWYPKVDKNKCINCGVCDRRCPSLGGIIPDQGKEKANPVLPETYAVWSLDENIRFRSTSGGVYYELASKFLENGGYIAGCSYTEDYKGAVHIIGSSQKDLESIMGSKYFQSDTKGIYKAVAALLKQKENVLFCGTPCQIAGLVSFLERKPDNLFLLDFICKGVNSPLAFRAYLQELENKFGSQVKQVRLKSKLTGWESLATHIEFKNGSQYHKDRYHDWWIRGYTCGNLFMRENCGHCLFKNIPHQSDITFGDFWGIKGCSQGDIEKGISVVFINSQAGNTLMEQIQDKIHLEKRSMTDVLAGNPYLFEQAKAHQNRTEFFELLRTKFFSNAVKDTYVETTNQKCKRYIKIFLKKWLKRKKW